MSKSILVVDDSMTMRQQLRALFESDGYRVFEAEHGEQGLSQAKSHSVDLVVVDVNMPVMGGIEMVRQMREMPGYAKTPIFVLTTEASGAVAARGKEVGATAWIVKPFKRELLLRGVSKMIGL